MAKNFSSIGDLHDAIDEKLEVVFKKTSNGAKVPEKLTEELRLFYVNTMLFLSDLSLEDAPLKAQEIYDYAIQAARDENIRYKSQISLHGHELVKADPVFQDGDYEAGSTEYAVLVHKLEALNTRKSTSESEITKLSQENQELTKVIEEIVTARENDKEKTPIQKEYERIKIQIELYEQEIIAISRNTYVSTSQNNKEIEKLTKEVEEMENFDKTLDRRIKYSCGGKTKSPLEPSVPSKKVKSTRIQKSPKKSPSPRKKGRNKSPSKTKKQNEPSSPGKEQNKPNDVKAPESPTETSSALSSPSRASIESDSNLQTEHFIVAQRVPPVNV